MTVENVWRRNVELGLNIKTYHATPLVVMTPPLPSLGALQVVITMVTCNHSDDKVGFMIIVEFRYYTHGLVKIRITIAIHCHLQRFLERDSLSYCRVLDTPVRVTVHNARPVTLNNGSISCDK